MPPFNQANILVHPPKDRSLIMIASGVFFGHVLLLLWAILMHQEIKPLPLPAQRRLIVQTVTLNPERRPAISTIAMQELRPQIKTETEPKKIAKEEIEKIEPKPILEDKIVLEEIEREIPANPPKEPEPVAITPTPPLPASENKEEIPSPSKEVAPKSNPAKQPESVTQVAKAPIPKKQEIKKKVEEKPIIKKAVTKPPAPKPELPKKTSIKPPEKKVTPSPSTVPVQSKKVEIDKAALERQKRMESEQQIAKAKQQKLLSQAQEMIAKIDKSRDKVSRADFSESQYANPGAITSLQSDSMNDYNKQQLSPKEASYRDELASRLKLLLKLPEYGEVKVKLTLERSGKVANVTVISTASNANRKYIEKMLPTMTFPAFGANFNQSPQFTFSITLCNDL